MLPPVDLDLRHILSGSKDIVEEFRMLGKELSPDDESKLMDMTNRLKKLSESNPHRGEH